MLNSKQITPFLEKVREEAEAAADAVYAKYQAEFERRVRNQMHQDHRIEFSMGSAYIYNTRKQDYIPWTYTESDFLTELASAVFYVDIRTGFSTETINK